MGFSERLIGVCFDLDLGFLCVRDSARRSNRASASIGGGGVEACAQNEHPMNTRATLLTTRLSATISRTCCLRIHLALWVFFCGGGWVISFDQLLLQIKPPRKNDSNGRSVHKQRTGV